jgi:hypothetical protein
MKRFAVLGLLANLLFVLIADGDEPARAPAATGLTVHEWGVFRVNEDADFANAALREEWDGLPPFVYGHIKGRVVPQHWGAFEERDRPIIFLHANKPALVRIKIEFPGGMAGVWFPATEKPAVFGLQKQPKTGESLEWNLGVKESPLGWFPKTLTPLEVPDNHWFARMRQVKSDEIFARFGPNGKDVEREKFIYYDGLFPHRKWLSVKVEQGRVALTSRIKRPVFDVTVVDRRDQSVRLGRIARIEAGETIAEVDFTEQDLNRFVSSAAQALLKQLVAAGLNDDEAQSLVDTWRHRMFETPGLTIFYRIAEGEYDAQMPLTVTPKPDSIVRVGLVYQSHLEPDFAERITELVRKLDSPIFADRDAAMRKLLAIGPAALVQLQRIRERKDLSAEVRERLDRLLMKWSAKEAFDH